MMKRHGAVVVIAVVVAGCSSDKASPTGYEIRTPLYAQSGHNGQMDFNLGTHLNGDGEVFTPAVPGGPTPADSKGQGQAIFRVNDDGTSVDFQLIASNIDNVVQAHIHCSIPGVNGPIRMWLYPTIGPTGVALVGPTGRHDGVLMSGTFNPTGVICPGSAIGGGPNMPLLNAMRAGLTYVNVHTSAGPGPANTGPGNFPGGEIRGQLDRPGNERP
jgi:hypothetical protein